jgi:hypothetical protein
MGIVGGSRMEGKLNRREVDTLEVMVVGIFLIGLMWQ